MKSLQEQVMKISNKCGTVFDIKRFATHDGEGIRTTIFLKGCPLNCVWCQNPEGIQKQRQVLYLKRKCIKCGLCVKASTHGGIKMTSDGILYERNIEEDWDHILYLCPTNALHFDSREYTLTEIMNEIAKDQVFYKHNGGVTLSGGEPLYQFDFAYAIAKECKAKGIHVAIETTLAIDKEKLQQIVPYLDQIYVDLKIMDDKQHRTYVGAGNKQILANISYLLTSEYKDKVIIRTPLIPKLSATKTNIKQISKFISNLDSEVRYELLNYNPLAKAKYEYLNQPYCFDQNPDPFTQSEMESYYELARSNGIKHIIVE
ncbi:pyruvate formate lyase activating enzyme [Breznakia sp. PF5-3]|uniref:glycyl-radical enzyme activating protein n=1 Tax=unclassified Breznakia TaxID=2623764 RepID=UPI0024052E8A|nr:MULTISPECIES: glycyl-radical enzyme activating protein [unclassified Breznakia]MDF9825281.1 pyruvate formate lyase activating enzyme [Breznakia sp. PM6-1]MDF9836173.1 pyruvate formate lyase activating enzyme [Breznakia sp. PF5-3]MDF9837381.1 pyruvate formate lyase activating enzyme [Breznakia sp. PFB2-8]MDF9859316.1 pyruvate formate lyase activating enzyme [Breznakia sp. PH5-24]